MQTIPQYGLTITLLNKNHRDEYMELKADLEEIGKLARKAPSGVRTVLLPDGIHWLTACSTGQDAFLGIYSDITKQISQDVLYDNPDITKRNLNTLKRRVESFVNNGIPISHKCAVAIHQYHKVFFHLIYIKFFLFFHI